MNLRPCVRKDELRVALERGHWPQGCSAELREHVPHCAECSLAAQLTHAMQSARANVRPSLPNAELVWWRAQLRKRQAAMQDVRKPLRRAQVFAVMLSFCVAVGLVAWLTVTGGKAAWSVTHLSLSLWLALGGAVVLLVSGVMAFLLMDTE